MKNIRATPVSPKITAGITVFSKEVHGGIVRFTSAAYPRQCITAVFFIQKLKTAVLVFVAQKMRDMEISAGLKRI